MRNVSLTLDRCHRILFFAHHKSGALHSREVRDHVEHMGFSSWPCEPLENFRIAHNSTERVGLAWTARVERKCENAAKRQGMLCR